MPRLKPLCNIVLTGASGGLGQTLAAELSAPGRVFYLLGRHPERLEDAANAVRRRGGTPFIGAIDLKDTDKLVAALSTFDAEHPVDLLICNAGVKTGNDTGVEGDAQTRRVIDVNLSSTISTVQALLPAMRKRGGGRIAIVGSLAGISPHADLLSYSATKAGLHGYAVALRRSLRGSQIAVTTIIPGFIDTRMTDRHRGPAPMRYSANRAAQIIVRGLMRGRSSVVFPRTLIGLAWLGERLPAPIADRIMQTFRAEILPDNDEMGGTRT